MAKNKTETTESTEMNDPQAPVMIDDIVATGFEKENISFAPYWKPHKVGDRFLGTIIGRDDSDPNFVRYLVEAKCGHICGIGSTEDGEVVTVNPGETFTVNVYAGLPLYKYYGITVLVTAVEKRKHKMISPITNQLTTVDLWKWTLEVDRKTKAMLDTERATRLKRFIEQAQEARMLPSGTKLNTVPKTTTAQPVSNP